VLAATAPRSSARHRVSGRAAMFRDGREQS
jgi:hypothetical protein